MKRGLNQFNLPDWFENAHWHVQNVCVEEPYVNGELTLYVNGDVKLGRNVFSSAVPIDDCLFAGGFVGKRRLDQLEWLVIRLPSGKHDYYRYRKLIGIWEQYLPFQDPVLDKYVQRFGPRIGSAAFAIDRGLSALVRLICGLALFALLLAAGAILLGLIGLAAVALEALFK